MLISVISGSLFSLQTLIICSWLSIQYLVYAHLCYLWFLILATDREYVLPPPELLGSDRIPLLGPLHVLVHLGDGHQEVPLVAQDGPRQQNNKTTNCCVLKIRYLQLTRSKFNSPA